MIHGVNVFLPAGTRCVRAVTMRKYVLQNSLGEDVLHLSEVDNNHCISHTFPLGTRRQMIDFAQLFMLQNVVALGVNEEPDESTLLREFFIPNTMRTTTLTVLEYDEEGQRSHWIHKPALNFYTILKASDVKNVGLMKDENDVRAMLLGPEYVSVSVTYPMATPADKCNFSRCVMECTLVDFMHPHSRMYLTNCLVTDNDVAHSGRVRRQQAAAAAVAVADQAQQARQAEVLVEATTDDEESDHYEEVDDEDPSGGDRPSNQAARDAVRDLSNTLFEHKEGMSEHAYVQLSNALKRSHEEICS